MTCIVGFIEKGTTWMGGDSLGSNGFNGSVNKHPKVFHSKDNKEIIMGYTSSFRMGQLLMFGKDLFDELSLVQNKIDYEYMVTKFIPNIQNLFAKGGYEKVNNSVKSSGEFLLGHKDRLYKVQSNYSVLESSDNYNACGGGEYFAVGALKAMEDIDLTPIERIHKALQAASKFCVGVSAPFHIINSENDEIITFNE